MVGLIAAAAVGVVAFVAGWLLGRAGRESVESHPVEQAEPVGPSIAEVFEAHRAGVVIADADGTVTYRNRSVEMLSGTHAGVLLDEAIERHVDPSVDGTGRSDSVEIYGPPKIILSIESKALPSGGTVVFVDDVTERRRVEEVRTDFVANISHELKTPIGALAVLAETLVDVDDRATIDRLVGRMTGEAQRASRMIDDLMELSRIETGAERVAVPVPVVDIVDGAVERVTELVNQSGIDISVLLPTADTGVDLTACWVEGDRRQLVSAFGNLVENAVKHSESGQSVQIGVRVDDATVELMVADQGPGIPQRDLDRVFERFYRVDRARSRSTGGTGLGLSIVRHVATNHHGDVTVASEEGQGSTFTLSLPLRTRTESSVGRAEDVRT